MAAFGGEVVVEQALLVIGSVLVIAGIAGSVLPFLPGPPLGFAGLILLQLSSRHPFTVTFLVAYGVITVLVLAVDVIIPVYSTKKFSASRPGVWGSVIGLLSGLLFFPPFGIIIGAVAGAFIGELVSGKRTGKALKSAAGSLAGFLAGSVIKLALSVLMAYHFFSHLMSP